MALVCIQMTSCSDLSLQENSSQVKQAGLACVVTGPGFPTCAAIVTGAEWAIKIIVGGVVVATAITAASSTAKTVPIAGGYTATVRPKPTSNPVPCNCTFSNSISAFATGDSMMMACGIAIGRAGAAACAATKGPGGSKASSLSLIGSQECLSIFGRGYRISC